MKLTQFTLERTVTQTATIFIATMDDEDPTEVMESILSGEDLPEQYQLSDDEAYPDLEKADWNVDVRVYDGHDIEIGDWNPLDDCEMNNITPYNSLWKTPRLRMEKS